MFSIVVLILLSCHTVSCVLVIFAQYVKEVHRELMMLQFLSVTLSAAVNFLVYIGFGKAFREEFRKLMASPRALFTGKTFDPKDNATVTQTSRDGESSSTIREN